MRLRGVFSIAVCCTICFCLPGGAPEGTPHYYLLHSPFNDHQGRNSTAGRAKVSWASDRTIRNALSFHSVGSNDRPTTAGRTCERGLQNMQVLIEHLWNKSRRPSCYHQRTPKYVHIVDAGAGLIQKRSDLWSLCLMKARNTANHRGISPNSLLKGRACHNSLGSGAPSLPISLNQPSTTFCPHQVQSSIRCRRGLTRSTKPYL